jgi:hypothetical protein
MSQLGVGEEFTDCHEMIRSKRAPTPERHGMSFSVTAHGLTKQRKGECNAE